MVYHYTSVDTLRCLIESVPKSKFKDSFLFQASNILFMNDPNEFIYGRRIFIKALKEIEDEICIPNDSSLSTLWSGNTPEEEKIKEKEYIQYLHNLKEIPYVLSFSLLEDSLPMWLNYGDCGRGVCLAFQDNREQPFRFRKTKQGKQPYVSFYTSDVYYNDLDKTSGLYNMIYDIVKDYKGDLEHGELNNRNSYFDALIQYVAPFIKTLHYKSESEVRVSKTIAFHHFGETNVTKFRCNKYGNIVPYIDIDINVDQLKYVILGPLVNFDLAKQALDMMAEIFLDRKIEIRHSEVEYREY